MPPSSSTNLSASPVVPAPAPKRRRWLRFALACGILAAVGLLLRPVAVDLTTWRSRVCLDERAHDRALFWLKTGKMLNPNNAEIEYLLARTERRLGRFDRVQEHLQRAHELGWDPRDLEREQLIALAQTGQYAAVKAHWPNLLQNAGADGPEICNAYVAECLVELRLQDALRVLTAWEADFPADAQPHFLRGRVWESLQKWSSAAEEFNKAFELNPGRTDIRLALAKVLMRQVRHADAEQHLRYCVQKEPGNAEATVALATCLQKLDQPAAARALLEQQLAATPDHVATLRALGDLELEAGRPRAALAHLRRAVELEPVDREIRFALATALEAGGDTKSAQKEFALVNEATKPMLRLSKLTSDLVREPDNAELRYEIADITWHFKSRTEGARWFHSVLELAPNHAKTHRALAEHYRLLGDTTRAAQHQRLASENAPPAP